MTFLVPTWLTISGTRTVRDARPETNMSLKLSFTLTNRKGLAKWEFRRLETDRPVIYDLINMAQIGTCDHKNGQAMASTTYLRDNIVESAKSSFIEVRKLYFEPLKYLSRSENYVIFSYCRSTARYDIIVCHFKNDLPKKTKIIWSLSGPQIKWH